jgi:phenylacetate-coenzyme A ligase PaaK-like adenylate-forming protein
LFQWQLQHNPVYKEWVTLMVKDEEMPEEMNKIPFLPISFFKTHDVFVGDQPNTLFESSGTTQDVVSKHWVSNTAIYEQSFLQCFQLFYGAPTDYCVIGLLPSYLERKHSSLVYMVNELIKQSNHPDSGFYLDDFASLDKLLKKLELQNQKVWLMGVSFALIDFSAAFPQQLNNTIVIETGGMKGRKQELTKTELHHLLETQLGVQKINSEYGMTELLSQAYSHGDGVFTCPPWMKVLVSDEDDPSLLKSVGRGVLHIIDLANIYSCSFIATQDLGEINEDGSFQVLGRVDASDRRGCSLMVV